MDNDFKAIELCLYLPKDVDHEQIARSYLKDPDKWEFFGSDYNKITKEYHLTLYQGELHSDDAW